ncbi:NADPH:quinone oxidoreductase family protein [Anaerolineales bacterium]
MQNRKLVVTNINDDLREALEIKTETIKQPGSGEILVKNLFSGVNAADYLMAAGRYLSNNPPPFDLGSESAGEVIAVGEGVENLKVGDHVSVLSGGYSEYFLTKARFAIPVPQATAEVVGLMVSGLTAIIALEEIARIKKGETVLVTAAAGGTGSFAVQLAKAAGCTLIGTCSSDEKVDYLNSLGCDRPINYKKEDLKSVLKNEFPKGVDVVFDGVGGRTFDIALNALAIRGRLLVIGAISEYQTGPQPVSDLRIGYKLMNRSASIHGFWLMNFLNELPAYGQKLIAALMEGKIISSIDSTEFIGLEGALDAIEYLYSGANAGKVVVRYQ